MLKSNVGSLVLVLGVAFYVCSCGSGGETGATSKGGTTASGGASATGGTSATGGASATGGSATTGGAMSSGGTAAGGATGTSTMTLAEACAHNCTFAVDALDQNGSATCSTTQDVCVQSCMTTFDNTSALNPDLGKQYTTMMVCVATDPSFNSSADFICAKPNSPLNLWSPVVDPSTDSPCKQQICDWNCDDATHGDMDPWVDLLCACSSV